eukprot:2435976-Pyramimonas_sp.AAC.3
MEVPSTAANPPDQASTLEEENTLANRRKQTNKQTNKRYMLFTLTRLPPSPGTHALYPHTIGSYSGYMLSTLTRVAMYYRKMLTSLEETFCSHLMG